MWKITVRNESDVIRHISVFAACHFNLNGFMQNRYYYAGNTGWTEFVPEVNGVFCRQKSPFMPVDMFSGYIMRLDLLMRDGKREELLEECKKLLLPMAERTGTLWEHNNICASCDHGFAAYSIKWLIYGLTGKDVGRTCDGK